MTAVTEANERIESGNTSNHEEAKMSDTYQISVTYKASGGQCWAVIDVEESPRELGSDVLPRESSLYQTPATLTWEAVRIAVTEAIKSARTEIERRRELLRQKPDNEVYII